MERTYRCFERGNICININYKRDLHFAQNDQNKYASLACYQ